MEIEDAPIFFTGINGPKAIVPAFLARQRAAVLCSGLIADMTVHDPEALRRGVDTDGGIKQAIAAL